MAWVSCTLLLYNLEKKRDEKCKESFMAPREKEEKGRKKQKKTKFLRKQRNGTPRSHEN